MKWKRWLYWMINEKACSSVSLMMGEFFQIKRGRIEMKSLIKRAGAVLLLMLSFVIFSGCGTEEASSSSKVQFTDFATKDLNGNNVTSDVFSGKKLTVVNVWGTFCPPCIGEMPELGQWAREMPEDVQIIGIVCDVAGKEDHEHLNLARKITGEAKVEFINIYPDETLMEILSDVSAVPTTFFVDSKGNVVGEPIIGADVAGYKAFVKDYLK